MRPVRDYVTYAASPLGNEFNRIMFLAFDQVFVRISRRIGESLADMMRAQPL